MKTKGRGELSDLSFQFKPETPTLKFSGSINGESLQTTAVSEGQARRALIAKYNRNHHLLPDTKQEVMGLHSITANQAETNKPITNPSSQVSTMHRPPEQIQMFETPPSPFE